MLPPSGSIGKEHIKTQTQQQLRTKNRKHVGILAFDLLSVKAYSIEIAMALLPSPSEFLTIYALLHVLHTYGFKSPEYPSRS